MKKVLKNKKDVSAKLKAEKTINVKNLGNKVVRKFCYVTFTVNVPDGYDKVYICGDSRNLAEWKSSRAYAFKNKDGAFVIRKRFAIGQKVEFKALADRNWGRVEKGSYGEEISNHVLYAEKGLVFSWTVPCFNTEHFE